MKISVVMTMYNGVKFLEEQLDSLRLQSRKIDEVLIIDDCSKDNSVKIAQDYILKHNLENWRVIINSENKGWKRNFHEGVALAAGDIVFPCDQDDIWCSDKVECMTEVMENNDKIDVLVGRYEIFNFKENTMEDAGNSRLKCWSVFSKALDKMDYIARKKANSNNIGIIREKNFKKSFLNIDPGCCFCIRKSFYDSIEKYWFPELGHDALYTFTSELEGSYYDFYQTVIHWRHYSGSTSRPKGRSKKVRLLELDRNEKVLNMMKQYILEHDVEDEASKRKIIDSATHWHELRVKFIETKNPLYGIILLGYLSFYERRRAYITDWVYAFKM